MQAKGKSIFVPDVMPHDLRHTWATMGIVARYAKKMPDTYREEIRAWWGLESGTDLARI